MLQLTNLQEEEITDQHALIDTLLLLLHKTKHINSKYPEVYLPTTAIKEQLSSAQSLLIDMKIRYRIAV